MTSLPLPDAQALAHSRQLVELIRAEIEAAGGSITFARYKELALGRDLPEALIGFARGDRRHTL